MSFFGFDPTGMNAEDTVSLLDSQEPYEGREQELVEQAAQLARNGDRGSFPDRVDRVGASATEKRSILRKHGWAA